MRLSDLKEDSQLDELLPAGGSPMGAAPRATPSPATGMQPAPKPGAMAAQQAPGQQSGLAVGQMDPAQAAAAAKDRMEQKKQVQDQIKQTEQQLNDLRKQLAELG
jgi:hypothetical protein